MTRRWIATLLAVSCALVALVVPQRAWAQTGALANAVAPAPDLSPYLGKLVTRVEAELDDKTWDDIAAPSLTSVKPNEPFTPGVARRALAEALAVGSFARGRVAVASDGAGVRLVVHLVPRKLLEAVHTDLHGARVDRDEVLKAGGFSVGGEIVARDLGEAKGAMQALLRRHGYPASDVTFTMRETDDPMQVLLLVDVVPGPPARVSRRVFYVFGADVVDAEPIDKGYAVGAGDRLDDTMLAAADIQLANKFRAKGWYKAVVSSSVVTDAAGATLRIRIDTGPRYLTRYEGNDHYDADALDGALGLEAETDRSFGHLVGKLKTFYQSHGFLDVEITLEARGADVPNAKEVFLVFHVTERRRVRVASRAYPCLKTGALKDLGRDAPGSPKAIGDVIDAYLEDELPGADIVVDPDPNAVDAAITYPPEVLSGRWAVPIDLDPDGVYVDATYDRAVSHLEELFRNEGFLHATVGPVLVLRRRCDPRSPPGACRPLPLPHPPPSTCSYDATTLPTEDPRPDTALTCVPDAARGVACEGRLDLRIPIKLGPRTTLYDLAFRGVKSLEEKTLAQKSEVELGGYVSSIALEQARKRVVEAYREEGFAYADVKVNLDESLDHTRARATFEVVEGPEVIVDRFILRGNDITADSVIKRRIALEIGQPYRASLARKTQERIATLNVFTTVDVSLENAYLPQARKAVVITVKEQVPQYVEPRIGLSTGEGIRIALEYGDRNIAGDAVGFSFKAQLSYLPDFLILDPQVKTNFDTLGNPGIGNRLAGRIIASFAFPDIGLGPLVRATTDAIGVRDLERDFYLTKGAAIVNLFYRPIRQFQIGLSPDIELNDVHLFQYNNIAQYLSSVGANSDLSQLLRVPCGTSYALAQKVVATWDRRDNSFNARTGTLLVSGVEHIDWTSIESCEASSITGQDGHTVRFTETFAGYIPIGKSVRLAAEVRAGLNVQTTGGSTTYPDRLFFLGGEDSMRGWLLDTFVPQEYADLIAAGTNQANAAASPANNTVGRLPCATLPCTRPNFFNINDVALRGGNLMLNPRLELRIPIREPLETVLFVDAGNLWLNPLYPFQHPQDFNLRYDAGTGVRLQTPIGPIALDYGVNLSRLFASASDPRRLYEDPFAFNFAIGLF